MIAYRLNGQAREYDGDPEESLLDHLRLENKITSAKDGCSGQGFCGACTVEVNKKATLACRTRMKDLKDADIATTEGLPEKFRQIFGKSFADNGAVQCGFCSPGMMMRIKGLYNRNTSPSRSEIIKAISANFCRCTGYVKIVDAIADGFERMKEESDRAARVTSAMIGERFPKYLAEKTALGERDFVDDMSFEGMIYGALRFSDHPRAKIISVDLSRAEQISGVIRIFTADDIPGDKYTGLIIPDWPLMVGEGETTSYIGDVLAGVVAVNEAVARRAAKLIRVEYEILEAVTDVFAATEPGSIEVHKGRSNVLEKSIIRFGDVDKEFSKSAFLTHGTYQTQRVEHAFLETETAIAIPEDDGIRLFSQGQGAYVDRKLIAKILALGEEKVKVVQVQNGGGFGGKEDITVQGHASLFTWLLKKPVKVHLNRDESLIMHPKRHPVLMDISLACDKNGKFTALKLDAHGDTGAYASVGTKVMERVVGHATGGYTVPAVDIKSVTVYTNNIPSGAMRGFGVPQIVFALESCIDDLCRQGGFDRWQIRFDNALDEGSKTATGQALYGVGLKKTLLAVKEQFHKAKHTGIACGIKNTGVGNGMVDDSEVKIKIVSGNKVVISHGWSEMGQGIHTVAIQTLHQETGIDPSLIEVKVETEDGLPTGMTTSSRASSLLGNAIIDASVMLKDDLAKGSLEQLKGRVYKGKFICNWTVKPGTNIEKPVIHYSYGYATQVVILDDSGRIVKVIAAHDAGKILNHMLFEGQIEGAVLMGLGYALTEDFPMKNGKPVSLRFKDLGLLRSGDVPEIEVIGIEEKDPVGPYGAKGIGEIGMVPTAAAVVNAMVAFDGIKRTNLPVKRNLKK